jgi:hypothetical protein
MSGSCSEGIGEQNTLYPPPDKSKLFTKVDLFLQYTQLIGTKVLMILSIEHIMLVVRIAAIKWL